MEKLRKRCAKVSKMTIYYAGDSHYEVRKKRGSYTLVLNKETCDCKVWEMSQIPCVHGCAAIQLDHGKVECMVIIAMKSMVKSILRDDILYSR